MGLSAEETADWLAVASYELQGSPFGLLERGARHARRTCKHFSQIVPTIVEFIENQPKAFKLDDCWNGYAPQEQLPPPAKQLTQEHVDAMSDQLRGIGLGCGYLIERDGKVVLAETGNE